MEMECSPINSNSNIKLNTNTKISWATEASSNSSRLELPLVLEMPIKISTMVLAPSNQWDMQTMALINLQMKRKLR